MITTLKNKVAALIAVGNILIVVLLIAIGFMVVNTMHRLSSITEALYAHPFTVNNAAQVVKFQVEHIRDHMLEIALARDSKKAADISEHLAALDASVRERFGVVEANFLGDPKKTEEVHRLLDKWREARLRTIDLAVHGRWAEVQDLVTNANRQIFAQLDDDVDYIVEFTRHKADDFVQEADSDARLYTRRVEWVLASFAIVIFIVGWAMSRLTWRLIRAEEVAVEAISKAEQSYRSLFSNMLEGYVHGVMIYEDGRPYDFTFLDVNPSFSEIMGVEGVIGKNVSEVIPGIWEADPGLLEMFGMVAMTGKPVQFEPYVKAVEKWFSISVYSVETGHFVAVCNDITKRKDYERQMRLTEAIFNASSEAMLIVDATSRIVSVNPAFTRITGYGADEALGKRPVDLSAVAHDEDFYQEIRHSLDVAHHWEGDIWDKKKSGEDYAVRLAINAIADHGGAERRYAIQFSDITEEKRAREALSKHANFDPLTGLANRRMFLDHLALEIRKARRSHHKLALLFIDLDRFKEVNDTLGHLAGDQLLVEAARRIVSCVRESDIASRLGGDEFTLILPEVMDVNRIEHVAHAIIHSLGQPYRLGAEEVSVSASIGITIYPTDATDPSELLRNADQAMYLSKSAGRNCFHFFTTAMQEATDKHHELAQDLHAALQRNELVLLFQPIVDLQTSEIFKAETLLRWRHPVRGTIEPAEFIPIAEEIGLIDEIGDWVFREALAQAQIWSGLTGHTFRIGVNISPMQLITKGPTNVWMTHVHEAKLSGKNVSLEITEKTLLNDRPEVADSLLSLRDAGMEMAIGNFGVGYSSLSCLQKYKIDYLKIDRTVTMQLGPGSADMALSEAIIVMAHKLGMKVIAEGIETAEQRDLLRAATCDFGQGYFFSRPVPCDEFEQLLRKQP